MTQTTESAAPAQPALLSEWMTREELAAELALSTDTLARWQSQRSGPPWAKLGRRIMYRRSSVQEWLRTREQGAVAERRK